MAQLVGRKSGSGSPTRPQLPDPQLLLFCRAPEGKPPGSAVSDEVLGQRAQRSWWREACLVQSRIQRFG